MNVEIHHTCHCAGSSPTVLRAKLAMLRTLTDELEMKLASGSDAQVAAVSQQLADEAAHLARCAGRRVDAYDR